MAECGRLTKKGTPCRAPLVNGRCLTHGTMTADERAEHCRSIAALGGAAFGNLPLAARPQGFQKGEQHPSWKGDAATRHEGRHRAQALYPLQPCQVCGAEPVNRNVHRHHKDGNPLNNEPGNIAFLCVKHHAEAHNGHFVWLHEADSEPPQPEEAGVIEGTFTEI